MNYNQIYENLINNAKSRKLHEYSEVHHIIPKCMGGDDTKDNLVELTAREHFIAHLLLVKIYKNNFKLVKAVAMMCVGHCERRSTNRLYGKYRDLFRVAMSESQFGEKNSQYGTRWIHNVIEKKSVKLTKTEPLPDGWLEGRRINFADRHKQSRSEIRRNEQKHKYTEWYILYEQVGFAEFVKITGYDKSKPNLVQNFAKYVDSFKPQNGKRRG